MHVFHQARLDHPTSKNLLGVRLSRWLKLAVLAIAVSTAIPLGAQTAFYTDFNGVTAGFGQGANFNWGTAGTAVWTSSAVGTNATAAWVNAGPPPSNASLGWATGPGPYTATLTSAVSVGTIAVTNGTWSIALGANALTFNSTTDWTNGLVTSGTGSIIKAGTNTLTVTANNSYSGATTINAGTLKLG